MMILALVAIGGGVGSICRVLLGSAVQRATGAKFPVGTLAVNVAGCFAIGAIVGALAQSPARASLNATLVTGFCGGFTTFSAFSVETVELLRAGDLKRSLAFVVLSLALCISATAAGLALSS